MINYLKVFIYHTYIHTIFSFKHISFNFKTQIENVQQLYHVKSKVYRGGMGIWGGTGRFANIFQKQLFDNVKSPIFCWLIYHLKDIYSQNNIIYIKSFILYINYMKYMSNHNLKNLFFLQNEKIFFKTSSYSIN